MEAQAVADPQQLQVWGPVHHHAAPEQQPCPACRIPADCARVGHITCCRILRDRGWTVGTYLGSEAARHGQLDFCQWLLESNVLDNPILKACTPAAQRGLLKAVVLASVDTNQLHMLEWSAQLMPRFLGQGFVYATVTGQLRAAQLLHRLGHPWKASAAPRFDEHGSAPDLQTAGQAMLFAADRGYKCRHFEAALSHRLTFYLCFKAAGRQHPSSALSRLDLHLQRRIACLALLDY